MKTNHRVTSPAWVAAACAALCFTTGAFAADSMNDSASAPASASSDNSVDKNTVRLGYYFVHYSATAADLSGPFTPAGINLRVENVNTPYFAYLRRLAPHWELELAAGVPPKTKTYGVGPNYLGSVPFNGQEVATAKWFSPTVLLEYVFCDEHAAIRPYVGAGLNYTHFYDRQSTAAGNAANGGPTSTDLNDSVGPAATAGVSYHPLQHWEVMASFSIARVKSNYDSDTAGIERRTTVDFHPTTWVLGVGYSF